MRVGEFRGLAGRLAVDQALGPMGVELHHPVPHDLHRDPANPGRLGAGRSLIDRGQRQQPSGLRAILGLTGDRAQGGGVDVSAERNRHGEPPSFPTLNQTRRTLKTPTESRPQGLGIIEWPEGEKERTKYWFSALPETVAISELVDTARLRWRIEQD